jgi:cytochrome P450
MSLLPRGTVADLKTNCEIYSWDYLPFNGGARLCIGQQLALTEAAYVVARILQKFDKIEANPEDLETGVITQNLTLTSCPARQVKLRARVAKA